MWRGNAWKRHDAIETVSINIINQTHTLFAPCLLHPFTVQVFPVLWASLFTVAVVDMRSVILASPVVLPAAVGVFVVALLSLRRGRQPWLEAGL